MSLELIDKQDNFEIVRDTIAAILAVESAAQVAAATTAGKPDPGLWALKVYTERSNPWEQFQDEAADPTPIVNVWFDNATYDRSTGDVVERQAAQGVFNVDCVARGVSASVGAGHSAGDAAAAAAAQRAARLVRNILMAGEYTYLTLRGVVWNRWPQSLQAYQPQSDAGPIQNIAAVRLTLAVTFNEFSPQYVGETLDYISAKVSRTFDGQILVNADYDYSAP